MKNQKKINQYFPKEIYKKSQNNSFFSSVQMKYIPQQSDDEDLNKSIVFNSFVNLGEQKQLKLCPNEEYNNQQDNQQEPCSQNNISQFTQYTLMRKRDIQFTPTNQRKQKIKKNPQNNRNSKKISEYFNQKKPGDKNNIFRSTNSKFKKIKQVPITQFVTKKIRKKQYTNFLQLPKHVVLKIMMYLRLRENIKLSMTCFQLNQNYKFLWFYGDYFKNLDSNNFNYKEIDFIRQKSRCLHSWVLNTLLQGRRSSPFFDKTYIKLVSLNDELDELRIKPNKKNGQMVQIHDNIISKVLEQKQIRLSIQKVSLENCCCLRKVFDQFCNLSNLRHLIITNNSEIKDNQIYQIVHKCQFLRQVNISGCKKLTEQSLTHILTNCKFLETLNINGICKIFEEFNSFYLFKNPNFLQKLNISNIQISMQDIEQILQNCKILILIKIQKNLQLSQQDKKYLIQKYNTIKFIF